MPDNVLTVGIDILVGKLTTKHMGVRPDSRNMRMEFAEVITTPGIPLVLNTMPLEKQIEIITAPPLTVLDICGGGSFSARHCVAWGTILKSIMRSKSTQK